MVVAKIPRQSVWGCLRPTPRSRFISQIPEQDAGSDDCRTRTKLDIAFERAGRTAFVSAPAQFIVPTPAEPSHRNRRTVETLRAFVVGLPPKEVTLPSHHRRPHAACQGQRRTIAGATIANLQTGPATTLPVAPQPFRCR